ncbi:MULTISPECIES: SDR family oxidoreductase [unclassified Streptomyces]|jgi:enoyl-[acyl-carrier protein] reductase I|uniref:enoyl-ACP reductase FabI n=1 Tax=unclassified Streptomyces TaxID=2593676 RepID=UPI0033AC5361
MTTAPATDTAAVTGRAGLLEGRRGLVLGVVNQRSIAWGIARRLAAEGAGLGFTYRASSAGEWLRRATPRLAADGTEAPYLAHCDVLEDGALERVCAEFAERHGGIDFLVHAVAHADKDELAGGLAATSRTGFTHAMESSVYSLIGAAAAARPYLTANSSLLTLSYLGAERVCHGYNVLGVAKAALESAARYLAAELGPSGTRVNVLSAGPVRTLATFGLPNFAASLAQRAERSPLGRPITTDDVAGTALYLLSDLASGTTGETVYVDAGYHMMGTWPGDAGHG